MTNRLFLAFLLTSSLAFGTPYAWGQGMVQAVPGSTDADKLAAQMRAIASNPRDVTALVSAGELSLKLDDLSGAASLFARADKIDPRSGRVKAGEGALLVRSERPGEALRYFQQAESFGWSPDHYAADRALAYDLLGDHQRAQRDYRLALEQDPDDETVRDYALSLGIAGLKDQALDQLAPMLRRQDRGAWRARAFILAMNGDLAGASTIATTMMPPSMAQGLQPFFERLPDLDPVDRAFAVHFGEVRPTPERLADAKLAPTLLPLPRAAGTPVQTAAQLAPPPSKRRQESRRKQATAASTTVVAPPAPTPTALTDRAAAPAGALSTRTTYAAADSRIPRTVAEPPGGRGPARTTVARPQASAVAPPVRQSIVQPSTTPAPSSLTGTRTSPRPTAATPTTQARSLASPPAAPGSVLPGAQSATVATPAARMSESSILAKIVAGLPVPSSELGVTAPNSPSSAESIPVAKEPPPIARAVPSAPLKPSERVAMASSTQEQAVPALRLSKRSDATKAKAEAAAETVGTPAEKRAAARKAEAAKKEAEKKAADKKAAEEKAAEERVARTNPSRIWVQVAGGADDDALKRAFAGVKAKAPEVMEGQSGYATPLRATNRVLTGPFKTDAEAQSFINKLAKKGVSAFSFTSDKGQKVERLSGK